MGEEFPGPGKGTRQRTFSVLLHLSGSIFSDETPEPCGPRQAGQFSAAVGSAVEYATSNPKAQTIVLFICNLRDYQFCGSETSCPTRSLPMAARPRTLAP